MTTAPTDRRLRLHPRVALRPEPFGALAYHYDNRRLVFLKHPDVVRVVEALDGRSTVSETLTRCDIEPARRDGFERALDRLLEAHVLTEVGDAAPR